jgi:hypothetical protein
MIIWGFVDYENTGSLEEINISSYDRLMVFCGPKNNKIKLGELSTTEFSKIELIGIKTVGANNLDFHLSFYLGCLHEKTKDDVEFHIISNDSGFNGIVSHISDIGRKCKRVATRIHNTKPVVKPKNTTHQLSECATLVKSKLEQMDGKKRPRKKDSLSNWIKSRCNHIKPAIDVSKIFEELLDNSFISVSNSNVSYKL